MIFRPGTILMAALPYYVRLLIFFLLGTSALFTSLNDITLNNANTFAVISIALLMYLSMSAAQLTKWRLDELTKHLENIDQVSVIENTYSDTEFNKLANHINVFLRTLNRRDLLIKSCSQETRYTANELQNSSNAVAEGAQTEYLALEALVQTSNDMNITVNEISTKINSTSETANHTRQQSEEGKLALGNLQKQLEAMQSTVVNNQEQMVQLIKATQDISNFVSTIEQITSQINLLSLNAAIESARAGEAGRGFAVVANEVRSLAESTENATQDISNLVSSIATQVNESEKTSLKLIDLAKSAETGSNEVTNVLSSIYKAAQSTQEEIKLSTSLISEFSLSNLKMSERLQNIATISEQHSQASKDTKDMVKYLEWLSSRLEQKDIEA